MECSEFHSQSRNLGQTEASCVHLFITLVKCCYLTSRALIVHLLLLLFPPFPEVTCTLVWSSGQNATAATRSRPRTLPRANATWSVKERRATCAGEPTGCPSTGWSWARSQHAAVSLTPLQRQLQSQNPSQVLKENACWDYQMRRIFSRATFVWFWVNAAVASGLRCSVYPPPQESRATYITLPAVVCILNTRRPLLQNWRQGWWLEMRKVCVWRRRVSKLLQLWVFCLATFLKVQREGGFSNFTQLVSAFSWPSSCFGVTISKCKQEEQINVCACIH